jgi:hypothetical protein
VLWARRHACRWLLMQLTSRSAAVDRQACKL